MAALLASKWLLRVILDSVDACYIIGAYFQPDLRQEDIVGRAQTNLAKLLFAKALSFVKDTTWRTPI